MLSLFEKSFNAYRLNVFIEKKYLSIAVEGNDFPSTRSVFSHVCEFNKVLTEGDASENRAPGRLRDGPVTITNSNHTPPNASDVPNYMTEFTKKVVQMWDDDIVQLHAFVLWRLNWIHPFFDGNGRTARTFSYFLVCVKFGKLLPGKITITSEIQKHKEAHYTALRQADNGDLTPLENQTRQYLRDQLNDSIS